jgi:hypothetical protein
MLRTVNCINTSCLSEVREFLRQNGFHLFELDGEQVRDAASFFHAVVRSLPLDPPLSGSVNWDAFIDSVWGGLDDLGEERVALVWIAAERMLEKGLPDLLIAVDCFQQLAASVRAPDTGISTPALMLVFLIGDGENFKQFDIDSSQRTLDGADSQR